MSYQLLGTESHPLGVLASVSIPEGSPPPIPDDVAATIHPEERAVLAKLRGFTRGNWVAGRLALRAALDAAGAPTVPILRDDRGAPILPVGWVGSVSHKRTRAVAVVARDEGWRVGVDLEDGAPARLRIERLILTPDERAILTEDEAARWAQIAVRFSVKEAIYKALDPYVRRYVDFQEVALTLSTPPDLADATPRTAQVDFRLAHDKASGRFEAECGYRAGRDVLSWARIRRLPGT